MPQEFLGEVWACASTIHGKTEAGLAGRGAAMLLNDGAQRQHRYAEEVGQCPTGSYSSEYHS